MNAVRFFRPYLWLPAAGLLAGLVVIVMGGFGMVRPNALHIGTPAVFDTMIQWRDASHNWLLVADGQTNQLTIYNAVDGRPIRRLDVKRGINDASALAQRDGHLFVVNEDGKLGELTLPQLQMVASVKP